MTKEKQFFSALRDIFIGAKVEGVGGFMNLMSIKANYYRQLEEILKKEIDDALLHHSDFRSELFDKLYTFFNRYFTESGSIYFNQTPFHNDIYEKVYTDQKDVILFWKTHMLYYVKTDRIFRSQLVEFDDLTFFFDASGVEHKKANEKRQLLFTYSRVKDDGTIVFKVGYSERGAKTKPDEILKELKQAGVSLTEEQLDRALRIFSKQSEVDFFINKNARSFLQEQFKLWSYQYFWDGAEEWTGKRVNELQILKQIAFKIIDFIAQFEDELVKIWNKPKFVRNSNYVVTLDRVNDVPFIEKLLKHKGIKQQTEEWLELGIVTKDFKPSEVLVTNKSKKELAEKYEHLPIDTKYFKDLELDILAHFPDLDNQLDGWLIKSENYQALNTILPKFKEKVQTIYIDPPFNLDSSDQFLYRTNYKDSNWATLLENRISLGKDILNEKGSIFVRCDYNGNWIVRCILDTHFDNNFQNEISINRFQKKSDALTTTTESIFLYSKLTDFHINSVNKPRECIFCNHIIEPQWQWSHSAGAGSTPKYFLVSEKPTLLFPPKGRHWTNSQETINNLQKEGRIRINHNTAYTDCKGNKIPFIPEKLQSGTVIIDNNWTDIPGYEFGVFSAEQFSTQNSEQLLSRVIKLCSDERSLVLDYFLGSGTTTAVAHKLGRRWLGVEMGNHFETIIIPRMKRVLFYDKSGISKQENEYKGGGFFKYYELEQYEEVLARCKYEDGDLLNVPGRSPYQEYVFLRDLKLLDTVKIKAEKTKIDFNQLYPDIDIAETLSNLTGKWIKSITATQVVFTDGSSTDTTNLDLTKIQPLIWWK